jgi:hypothetical protein
VRTLFRTAYKTTTRPVIVFSCPKCECKLYNKSTTNENTCHINNLNIFYSRLLTQKLIRASVNLAKREDSSAEMEFQIIPHDWRVVVANVIK